MEEIVLQHMLTIPNCINYHQRGKYEDDVLVNIGDEIVEVISYECSNQITDYSCASKYPISIQKQGANQKEKEENCVNIESIFR